jgi:anthranilate phosphoribosyltransferase
LKIDEDLRMLIRIGDHFARKLRHKPHNRGVDTNTNLFNEVLAALLERRDLADEQIGGMMEGLVSGAFDDAQAATFMIALRMKGETSSEIAAAASVLRGHMISWDPGKIGVLDTCGTGGDCSGTFNISTATAVVVAAVGVPVVKHGNRAVSSTCGSADVLEELGVPMQGDPAAARRCLHRTGLAFCFAPHFHPALKHLAGLRRRLGVSTLFNCLGPLANPAGVKHQLLGVGRPELLDLLSGALARLGTSHSVVVCSQDGLDEVSLSAPTNVREIRGQNITSREWSAADFGLKPCALSEIRVEGAQDSARLIRGILDGRDGPPTRLVLANAAAALFAADRVHSLEEGVARAREAIVSGRARTVLEMLRHPPSL